MSFFLVNDQMIYTKQKQGAFINMILWLIIHVVLNDIMTPYYSHMKINIYTNRKIGDQMTRKII